MNYLALHDYRRAIQLALAMEQPGRLLALFKNFIAAPEDAPSITGSAAVDEVLRTLLTDAIAVCRTLAGRAEERVPDLVPSDWPAALATARG